MLSSVAPVDLNEAQTREVYARPADGYEPVLTPEQSKNLNDFLDVALRRSDEYRSAEARRIVRDREWYSGNQWTAMQDGQLVVAPAKMGVIPAIDNHTLTIVNQWVSVYCNTTPAAWEVAPYADSYPSNLKTMMNAALRGVALGARLEQAIERLATHVAVDGVRFLYPRFAGSAGQVFSAVGRDGSVAPVFDPRTGMYARTGRYIFDSLSATEILYETGARSLDESGYVVRLVRMTRSDAARLFGTYVAQKATRANNSPYWYRVRETVAANVFYGWADNQAVSNTDVLLLDCWVRPEVARDICGDFPGVQNGIRRIRMYGAIGDCPWHRAEGTVGVVPLSTQNGGTLCDEFWPRAAVVSGHFPFFPIFFQRSLERMTGIGIPGLTRTDQLELNLLAFHRVNRIHEGSTTVLRFAQEDEEAARNYASVRRNQMVLTSVTPELVQFPGVDPANLSLSEAARSRMEQRAGLFPIDFAKGPDDARAVNATVTGYMMEQARLTKRPKLDSFATALEMAGQYILADLAQSLPPEMLKQYAGDDDAVLAEFYHQAEMGMPDVRVVMSDANSPMPRDMAERVGIAYKAGIITDKAVARKAMFGPNAAAMGPVYESNSANARSLAAELRNFDKMPVGEQMPWLPWVVVDDTSQPATGVDPATGQPIFPKKQIVEIQGAVLDVPDGLRPAYVPSLWQIYDPYIEESQALVNNPADLKTISADAVRAREWYASQAKNGEQAQAQGIQEDRMNLRKQGESDKPLVAVLEQQGISTSPQV